MTPRPPPAGRCAAGLVRVPRRRDGGCAEATGAGRSRPQDEAHGEGLLGGLGRKGRAGAAGDPVVDHVAVVATAGIATLAGADHDPGLTLLRRCGPLARRAGAAARRPAQCAQPWAKPHARRAGQFGRPGQAGRIVPTPRARASARIASAKTRSARPTPRWVTSTRPLAGRGVRRGSRRPAARDRVSQRTARHPDGPGTGSLVDQEEPRPASTSAPPRWRSRRHDEPPAANQASS